MGCPGGDRGVKPGHGRARVEDQCCLDVSVLHKAGRLVPGVQGVVSWTRGAVLVGAITLRAEADALFLDWHATVGGTMKEVAQVVRMARVAARFARRPCGRGRGATTIYFLCPGCGTRRRKLYIVAQRCHCQACLGLGWAVEAESAQARDHRRSAKARARIGAKPGILSPLPPRFVPDVVRRGGRGPGRKKYRRLVQRIALADLEMMKELRVAVGRLEAVVERNRAGDPFST